ncbi:kinase-like protein [Sistotremastrum suecicum HHB10207 ss-3]|nr:kinase-like protein [Sistotremastrum suecicum HHB10207 ss-3]
MESVKIYVLSLSTAIKDAPSIIPNGRFEIVVEWNCGVHTLKLSTSTQFIRHYDRGIDQASVYRGVEGEGRLNRPSVVHAKVIDLESRETMFSGQHAVDAFSAFKNTSWELIKLYATVKDGISTDVRQGSAVLDLKIKVGRVHHMINLNIVSANDFVQAPDLTTRIERFPFNQDVWVMIDGPHEWTERRRLEDGMVEVRSFDCNREIADIIENGSSEINRVIGKWRRTLHANVVTPIGYSLHDCISIVYPLLRRGQENVDILSYIREFGATTLQRERMIRDVAEGLNFLHAMGIVHGNMRGANILIAGDGRAVVTGYGLNDILRHTSDAQVGMSDLRWNSPETVRTSPGDIRGLATKKSDIWGFG